VLAPFDGIVSKHLITVGELVGNGVATIVVSAWEGELDRDKLAKGLARRVDPSNVETAVTTG